jgi:hypothetical protein
LIQRFIHVAEVKDDDDILKEGRVQIFIENLMSEFDESHLPWARPFHPGFGGSSDYGRLRVPKKGSKVWVFSEKPDLLFNWFYMADVSLKKLNPIEKILTFLNGKFKATPQTGGLGLSSSYPDVDIILYPNGIYTGVSTGDNPEVFVYHPSALISIDKEGNISTKGTKWTHYGDIVVKEGDFEITKGGLKIAEGDFEVSKGDMAIKEGDVDVTKGKLDVGKDIKWNTETTATTASTHTHPTAATGSPSSPTPGS